MYGPIIRSTATDVALHRAPQFPPSMWNVSESFNNNFPTTTNHVEAWHRRLTTLLVIDHPAFFTCLHKIREEQRHTEVQIMRAETGFRRQRQRRSMTEHSRRLTTLMADLSSGRKDVAAFLRGVSHSFGRITLVDGDLEEGNAADGNMGNDVTTDEVPSASSVSEVSPPPERRRRLRDLPARRAAASTVARAAVPTQREEGLAVERMNRSEVTGNILPASHLVLQPPSTDCPVCLARQADTAIISCGHCVCISCINQIMSIRNNLTVASSPKRCPMCRIDIRDFMRIHFAV